MGPKDLSKNLYGPMGMGIDPPHPHPSWFPPTPPHTFMALNSLSAKYSGVLRIHFTEKREEEAELFWRSLGRGGLTPSLFLLPGDSQVQTQEEPGS